MLIQSEIRQTEGSSVRSRSSSDPNKGDQSPLPFVDHRRQSLDDELHVKEFLHITAGQVDTPVAAPSEATTNVNSFVQEIHHPGELVPESVEKELQTLHSVPNSSRNSMVLLGGIAAATTVALTIYGGIA